jgi:hypothetical protein
MTTASRGLERAMLIYCEEPLAHLTGSLGHQERQEGHTGGEIPFARANRRVEK